MKKIFITLFQILVVIVTAQDLHFSQYYSVPVLVNPAEAGRMKEDSRFTFIHRTQWAAINSKYNSTGISTDFVLMPSFLKRDNMGLGVYAVNDNIGQGVLKGSAVYVTLAYHALLDNAKRHRLSGGIQAGYTSKMIDDSYFQFYNQYIDFAYVPDRSSNENFKNYNYSFFDGQAGLYYTFVLNAKTEINYGTSFFQIHQPKESVLFSANNATNKLGTRSIYTLGVKYKLTEKLTLNPQTMYLRQSKAKDLNLGVLATYQFQKEYPIQAMGGIFCRTRDALIFMLGMRYKNLDIRYSYDMTTSSARQMRGALNATNKPLGAHEFVLNIYGKINRKNSREYTLPCGIF